MSSLEASKVLTSQDFYDISTHTGYAMDKYGGRVIRDEQYDRDVTVEYIFDLKFEDLDLEDQKLAIKVGWAWGVHDAGKDLDTCKQLKGYLFTPKQWRLWHAQEKFPAYIGGEGSGKTLIFWLIALRNSFMYPGTRGLFMRATYPQLEKASLPTLWKICAHFGWQEGVQYNHNISKKSITIPIRIGKKVITSEILYMPAKNEGNDIQAIIQDLRSLEIDYAMLDEIATIDELVCRAVRSRVGRWGKIGNPVHRKMIVGGNPPSEGSWIHKRWYQKLDNADNPLKDPDEHTVFVASSYENRRNLAPDIITALESSEDYWKNTFLYGQLGFVPPDGEPIYKNFNYSLFVSNKQLLHSPRTVLLRGWDIGPTAVNKACIVAQLDSRGVLIVLAEFMMLDPGVTKFGEYVKSYTNAWFPDVPGIRDFCDPVAFDISQTDGQSPATKLRDIGIDLIAGEESFQLRYDAVNQTMNRFIDGVPGMYIDGTRCRKLVEGFMGGYLYKIVDLPTQRFSKEPVKNMYSHYHDALQYLCSRLAFVQGRKRDESEKANRHRQNALRNKRQALLGKKHAVNW